MQNTLILIVFAVVILCSCSISRVSGTNMLEKKADYDDNIKLEATFKDGPPLFVPRRTEAQEVDVFVHPHETLHGDYFVGGFVRSIVKAPQWELKKLKVPKTVKEKKKEIISLPKKKSRVNPIFLRRSEKRKVD